MKKQILCIAFAALSISVTIFAESIPGTIQLGTFPIASDGESAVVVMSRSGDYICCYTDSGLLKAVRSKGSSPNSLSAIEVDIESHGIVSVRDLKAFNRFDKQWMVFFVATDAAGTESVRALEFDASDALEYSPYGAFDDATLNGSIIEYHVIKEEILSFYTIARKDSGVSIAYAGHDPDNRSLIFSRQSSNPLDSTTATVHCQKNQDDLEVVVDYTTGSMPAYRSVIATYRNGTLFARSDLGSHDTPIKACRSYRIDSANGIVSLVRGSGLDVWSSMNGQCLDVKTIDLPGSTILNANLVDQNKPSFLISSQTSAGVDLSLYDFASMQSRVIASAEGSIDASTCITMGSSSTDLYWIARDASDLRKIQRIASSKSLESWIGNATILERNASEMPDSTSFMGVFFNNLSRKLGFAEYNSAARIISYNVLNDGKIVSSNSWEIPDAIASPRFSKHFFSVFHDSPTLIAVDGEWVVYLEESGAAGLCKLHKSVGEDSHPKALFVKYDAATASLEIIGE